MKTIFLMSFSLVSFSVTFFVSNSAWALPARIILIRHAEKPEEKSDDLSDVGQERAARLAGIFDNQPHLADRGFPVAFLAAKYVPNSDDNDGVGEHSRRSIETLTPLATRYGMDVQSPYSADETPDMANYILTNPDFDGKTIMVAWVHSHILELVQALRAQPPVKKWKGSVFDRMWVIDYNNGESDLMNLAEDLLPGDDQSKQIHLK